MRVRSDSRRTIALVAALIVPTLACTKKPMDATSPNATSPNFKGGQAPGSGDPLGELAALEQEMQRLGLPVATERATVPAAEVVEAEGGEAAGIGDGEAAGDAPVRTELEEQSVPPAPTPTGSAVTDAPRKREQAQYCSDVCDLSQAICELESQICSLAEGHGDDPTYADACRRAGEDCDIADERCDRCQR